MTNVVVVLCTHWLFSQLHGLSQEQEPIGGSRSGAELGPSIGPLWPQGTSFTLLLYLQQGGDGGADESLQGPGHGQRQLLLCKSDMRFGSLGADEGAADGSSVSHGADADVTLDLAIRPYDANAVSMAGDLSIGTGIDVHKDEAQVRASASAEAGPVDTPVSAAVWEALQTNRTDVYLHIYMWRQEQEQGGACAHTGSNEDEVGPAADLALRREDWPGLAIIAEHLRSGRAIRGSVALVKLARLPKAYRRRYLLADLTQLGQWLDDTVVGRVLRNTVRVSPSAVVGGLAAYSATMTAEEEERSQLAPDSVISYWKPEVSVKLVADWTHWSISALPATILQNLVQVDEPVSELGTDEKRSDKQAGSGSGIRVALLLLVLLSRRGGG